MKHRPIAAAIVSLLSVLGLAWGAGPLAAEASTLSCDDALLAAAQSNSLALLQGAATCAEQSRKQDANFLMIVGQIRATADLTILKPTDEANAAKAGELYNQLYYYFGGLGFDEVYRASAGVTAIEARVRSLDLALASGYDPGWAYGTSSKTDIYAAILSNERERWLWQMRSYALKLQDDAYFEAQQALNELQRANPTLQQGTPAYDKYLKLSEALAEASKRIAELPPPPDTTPYARLYEQDPELAARQVATGFNGPADGGTDILRSEAEVRASWLAKAMSAQELDAMLAKTDFSTHWLISYGFGQRTNASGQAMISELGYRKSNAGYAISTNLGIVPDECGASAAESYPFVVGLVEAVPGADIRASGMSHFPAECGPIASGTATPGP